jgi:hypothetical protein
MASYIASIATLILLAEITVFKTIAAVYTIPAMSRQDAEAVWDCWKFTLFA